MSRKRDTFMAGPAPRYQSTPTREAARFLANVARRFLADRANVGDVNKAIEAWKETAPPPAPVDAAQGETLDAMFASMETIVSDVISGKVRFSDEVEGLARAVAAQRERRRLVDEVARTALDLREASRDYDDWLESDEREDLGDRLNRLHAAEVAHDKALDCAVALDLGPCDACGSDTGKPCRDSSGRPIKLCSERVTAHPRAEERPRPAAQGEEAPPVESSADDFQVILSDPSDPGLMPYPYAFSIFSADFRDSPEALARIAALKPGESVDVKLGMIYGRKELRRVKRPASVEGASPGAEGEGGEG